MAFKVKDKLSGQEKEEREYVFCKDKEVYIDNSIYIKDELVSQCILQFICVVNCEYLLIQDDMRAFSVVIPKSEVLLLIEGLQHLYNQMK